MTVQCEPDEQLSIASDVTLWNEWKQGHEPSFRELLNRYADLVWSVCRRILFREQDSEDAFQVTFVTLFRRGDQIQGETFGPWVRRVAFHAALQIRDQRIRENLDHTFDLGELANSTNSFEHIENVERNLTLEQALNALPDHLYTPLVQFHLEGRSRAEIASHCRITETRVKSRLQQARQKLRDHLRRKGLGVGALLTILNWPEFARAATPRRLIEKTLTRLDTLHHQTSLASFLNHSTMLERRLNMTSHSLGIARGAGIAIVTAVAVTLLSVVFNPNKVVNAGPENAAVSPPTPATASLQTPPGPVETVLVSPPENMFRGVPRSESEQRPPGQIPGLAAWSPAQEASSPADDHGDDRDISGIWNSADSGVSMEIDPSSKLIRFRIEKSATIPWSISAVGEYRRMGDMLVGVVVHLQMNVSDYSQAGDLDELLRMKAMLRAFSDEPFMIKLKPSENSIFVRDIRVGLPTGFPDAPPSELVPFVKGFVTQEFARSR